MDNRSGKRDGYGCCVIQRGGQPVKIITNSPSGATPNRYFTKCLQYNIDQQLWLYRMVEVDLDPNGVVQANRVPRAREFRYDPGGMGVSPVNRRYLERDRDPNTLARPAETWRDYVGNNIYQVLAINVVDPNHPVAAPTARYDRGYNLAAIDDIAGRRFVHFDMLGTTRMLTDDPGGAIASAASYTSFGEVAATSGTNATRYGYVGSWGYQNDGLASASNDIGMLHVGARHYHPAVGRFVQRDPIAIGGGMNEYAYVAAQPTIYLDPAGLELSMAGQAVTANIIISLNAFIVNASWVYGGATGQIPTNGITIGLDLTLGVGSGVLAWGPWIGGPRVICGAVLEFGGITGWGN